MNGVLFFFLLGILLLGCLSVCATLERQLNDLEYNHQRTKIRVWQWTVVLLAMFAAVALGRYLPG